MSPEVARLEILKLLVPNASRQGITDPTLIIECCSKLEEYVLGLKQAEDLPDSAPRKSSRPRKEKSDAVLPSFLDPTHGG